MSAEAIEIPGWVKETPEECSYGLVMRGSADGSIETVDISRDEFVTLKSHLAAMRGYVKISADDAITQLSGIEIDPERRVRLSTAAYSVARELQLARIIYRKIPAVVVVADAELDARLGKIGAEEEDVRPPRSRRRSAS